MDGFHEPVEKKNGCGLLVFICILMMAVPLQAGTGKPPAFDPDLWLKAGDLIGQIHSKKNILPVDVRSKKEHEEAWIPGSINIPVRFIKTRAGLRNRKMILFDNGFGGRILQLECERLKKAGFRVSLLFGGIHAWIEAGGLVEGNPFARKGLNRVKPRKFFQEKDFDGILLVDISKKKATCRECGFDHVLRVPFGKTGVNFVSGVKKAVSRKGSKFIEILIFNQKGTGYPEVDEKLRQAGVKGVFFLDGGMEGCRKSIRDQRAALSHRKNGKKNAHGGCGACP